MNFPIGYIKQMIFQMCLNAGFIPERKDLDKAVNKYLLIASIQN